MLKICVFLAGAMLLNGAAEAQAHAELSVPGPEQTSVKLTKEQADKIISQCQTRKFESSAIYEIDGHMRQTAVRLCALPGQSDAAWIYQLQKAADGIEARTNLPEDAKAKLLTDIRGEITRLNLLLPSKPAAKGTIAGIAPAAPPSTVAPLVGRPAPAAAPLAAADALVATVPPMPPPLPPQKDRPIGPTPASKLVPPPPLSIACIEEGERGDGGPCGMIGQGTVLAVKADADLGGPATLRFLRKGSQRDEVPIRALKQGELVKLRLPPAVCAGVVHSELAIEIVTDNLAGGSDARGTATKGPYDLRC